MTRVLIGRLAPVLLAVACHLAWANAATAQLDRKNARVHDPSTIIKCGDEYWLFFTGRGIPSYRSKDLIDWQPGPPVFSNAPPWVAGAVPGKSGNGFWAPDIVHVGNRYLLYYSASIFGKKTSAIGLATNPTLNPDDRQYRWTDRGIVIQSGARDDFNAIDPAVAQDEQGGLWLAFGSFWSGIKLIQLDPSTGQRLTANSTIYSLAHAESIEAPYIHHHGTFYYLFVNWGLCCRGTNSTYNIRIGRSDRITGPYLDKTGKDMREGGGSLFLGSSGPFVGPGHAGILEQGESTWFSCHFYDGDRGGARTLGMARLRWQSDGWPTLAPAE